MQIRPAVASDHQKIWSIISPVIRAGETYALDRDISEHAALAYWFSEDKEAFVADDDGDVVGTY